MILKVDPGAKMLRTPILLNRLTPPWLLVTEPPSAVNVPALRKVPPRSRTRKAPRFMVASWPAELVSEPVMTREVPLNARPPLATVLALTSRPEAKDVRPLTVNEPEISPPD